jgi:MFS family permease
MQYKLEADAPRRTGTFAALQHRNYQLYFGGQLISNAGTWMQIIAQGWLVYQLTGSKALLGVVAAAASAPMLVFSTLGGWIADRYPKRSVIVVTQLCSMFVSLTMAALVWTKIVQPWHIIALAVVSGVTASGPKKEAIPLEAISQGLAGAGGIGDVEGGKVLLHGVQSLGEGAVAQAVLFQCAGDDEAATVEKNLGGGTFDVADLRDRDAAEQAARVQWC